MYNFDQLLTICEERITELKLNRKPSGLYSPIIYALSNSGKRVRPVALLISANIFTEKLDDAINAALSIEVFHNFTLLHDDIMDNASTRRGKPTVHKQWNNNTAILSGDAMVIFAYSLLQENKTDSLSALLDVFCKTALGVCEGQQYDMEFEKRDYVTIAEYLEMIRLKTGVLIAGAMKMGAICGGASEKNTEIIYEIGENLGLAFQIQDDYLDTYGNSENFGKMVGGDIIEAKKTFLYLTALKNANDSERDNLNKLLHSDTESQQKIESVRNIYNKLHVPQETGEAINKYFDTVWKLIDSLECENERKTPLRSLAKYLLQRDK